MNQQMMKQIQQLQDEIAKAQKALEETTIEASAGGGAVSVVMTAQPKMNSITVQPEVVDPDDVEMLQDLIMAAVNEALEQIRATQMQQMAGIAGGLNIPGLTG
jgi:DNA-binding YbaB/EbfC family protein